MFDAFQKQNPGFLHHLSLLSPLRVTWAAKKLSVQYQSLVFLFKMDGWIFFFHTNKQQNNLTLFTIHYTFIHCLMIHWWLCLADWFSSRRHCWSSEKCFPETNSDAGKFGDGLPDNVLCAAAFTIYSDFGQSWQCIKATRIVNQVYSWCIVVEAFFNKFGIKSKWNYKKREMMNCMLSRQTTK